MGLLAKLMYLYKFWLKIDIVKISVTLKVLFLIYIHLKFSKNIIYRNIHHKMVKVMYNKSNEWIQCYVQIHVTLEI